MPSSPITSSGPDTANDLSGLRAPLSSVPDPRARRGKRHTLAGLLAIGVAAVLAEARSFAAFGSSPPPTRRRCRVTTERAGHRMSRRYPAYTTGPGWLGYGDEKLERLACEAVADGFKQIKLKVGANLEDDKRHLALARSTVGPDIRIAVDANQFWDVDEAVEWMSHLTEFRLAWVEEPTSPDDVLGSSEIARRLAPMPVATGEHVQNRVIFKQMPQARSLNVLQMDACRVGGVNENISILLLAVKFGIPVAPHAGGVGLCETVQHMSMFDYVAVSRTMEGRMIEFADHLYEHFVTPACVVGGRYRAPTAPGAGSEMLTSSIEEWVYPDGSGWTKLNG